MVESFSGIGISEEGGRKEDGGDWRLEEKNGSGDWWWSNVMQAGRSLSDYRGKEKGPQESILPGAVFFLLSSSSAVED